MLHTLRRILLQRIDKQLLISQSIRYCMYIAESLIVILLVYALYHHMSIFVFLIGVPHLIIILLITPRRF